jgi:hypothetical protein
MDQFQAIELSPTAPEPARRLANQIVLTHLECERHRRRRVHLVHLVAVLSAPVALQAAYPRLWPPTVARMALALWLGTAAWALVTAVAEIRTLNSRARRMGSLRALSISCGDEDPSRGRALVTREAREP